MKKEIPSVVSSLIAGSMMINSCVPFEPKPAHAASLHPTSQTSLFVPPDVVITIKSDPIENLPEMQIRELKPLPFIYFPESSFNDDVLTADKARVQNREKMNKVACGILVGAMVTRTNPYTYLNDFNDYFKSIGKYGPARITRNGSDMQDHLAVLKSLGYGLEELSVTGSTTDGIKKRIKELTNQGVPIWVNAYIIAGGHHSMAVAVSPDGNIIFNDPLYGEGKEISDSKIHIKDDKGNILWKVYAIYPPTP